MKKILLILCVAGFAACNNDGEGSTTGTPDTSTTNTSTTIVSDTNTTSTTTTSSYSAKDGDVTYRGGKVMVYRNNEWVASDKDVELEGGVVVRKDGRVERNGQVVKLEEGETVDRTGRFFDKAGNAIENAWDATKRGARKAKEEVKEVFKDEKNN